MKHLILGGARSGKSAVAEQQAQASRKKLHYIATGWADDDEMARRIDHHKKARSDQWLVIEEPIKLSEAIKRIDNKEHAIVIDCLTLWLCNCLSENCLSGNSLEREKALFLEAVSKVEADIFIVSNEVGSGVVPLGNLPRLFVDESGWLHQELAKICDHVSLIVAGLPLALKGSSF